MWFTPCLIFLLVYMPYNFLKNFGITFLCYLRGVGSSLSLVVDFLFDIVVVIAMFFRFFIQGIRVLLILLVYVSLQEVWFSNEWVHGSIVEHESMWADLFNVEFNLFSLCYFFFFKLPFWV